MRAAESGAYASFQDYQQFIVPLADAEAAGTDFAGSVGCGNQSAQCLRATSANTLVNAQPGNLYQRSGRCERRPSFERLDCASVLK